MKTNALERLLLDFQNEAAFAQLSDSELADALMREVWSKATLGTRESALLCATIERLRRTRENP